MLSRVRFQRFRLEPSVSAHGGSTSEYLLLKCLVCDLQYCRGYKRPSRRRDRNMPLARGVLDKWILVNMGIEANFLPIT